MLRDINSVDSTKDLQVVQQKYLLLKKLNEFIDEVNDEFGGCYLSESVFQALSSLSNEPDMKAYLELISKNLEYRKFRQSPENDITIDTFCLKVVEAEQKNRRPNISLTLES